MQIYICTQMCIYYSWHYWRVRDDISIMAIRPKSVPIPHQNTAIYLWSKVTLRELWDPPRDPGGVLPPHVSLLTDSSPGCRPCSGLWAASSFSQEKDLNKCFLQEDRQMAKRYIKRRYPSLIIRKIQIKITVKLSLSPKRDRVQFKTVT